MSDLKTKEQILTEYGIINRGVDNSADTLHLQIGESKYKAVLDAMEKYKQQASEPTMSDEPALNIDLVSKSFTSEQIETAYDVGFCDGCEEARPAY